MRISLVALIVLLLVGIGIGYFLIQSHKKDSVPVTTNTEVSFNQTPFENMTIPYLRKQPFTSQLGEQKEFAQANIYTSYLTSYTSEGLRINALLTRPTGSMPEGGWPAIIFVHGYIPPTLYKTTQRYGDYIDFLARNGFVVLKIDLRGHGDSEGTPTGAYYSSGYVIDTLSAYDALTHADFVNPNKVGLWGHSMAGNIVLRSAVAKPEIKAVAIWAGAGYTYTDLLEYRINDTSYRPPLNTGTRSGQQRAVVERYGQFSPDDAFWKTVAPTNYLSDLRGAVALFHAKDDAVVSIEYSRNLQSLLDATSVSHELHEYPTGGHNINGASFSKAMKSTVEFYKKYL